MFTRKGDSMKYTPAMHAADMPLILRKVEGKYSDHDYKEIFCPVSVNGGASVCEVCLAFVGLELIDDKYCPCQQLGCDEAIRRSYEALADWQVGSHPMSPEPRVKRPQKPEGR